MMQHTFIREIGTNASFGFSKLDSKLKTIWLDVKNPPFMTKAPLIGSPRSYIVSLWSSLAKKKDRKACLSHQEGLTKPSLIPHVSTSIHTFLWKSTIASVSEYIRKCQASTLWHLRDLVLKSRLNCLDDILICLTADE